MRAQDHRMLALQIGAGGVLDLKISNFKQRHRKKYGKTLTTQLQTVHLGHLNLGFGMKS